MTTKWNVHPVADLFPLMEGEEFDSFLDDCQQNGIIEPVVTHKGLLLDGRNRVRAADTLGLDVDTWEYEGDDPVGFILSLNIERRHLDPSQRGMIGAEIEEWASTQVKRGRPVNGAQGATITGKAVDHAGRQVGVSGRSISRAKRVRQEAPDLVRQVVNGKISLKEAERRVRGRTRHERQAAGVPVMKPAAKQRFQRTNDFVGWAHWSWNPVTGCNHGCPYCYARDMAERFQRQGVPGYEEGFVPAFHENRLDAPLNTSFPDPLLDDRARRVFVCSMADLFGKWVPQEWIDKVFAACHGAPAWEYLFLTKFPSRYHKLTFPPNSWAGASVDTQRRVTPTLKAMENVTAKVRWLSLEPLLEPLTFPDLSMFNLVVIGAQTEVGPTKEFPHGHPAWAPQWEWVMDIVTQARQYDCAVYLKENLVGRRDGQHPGMVLPQELPSVK